jgi:Zn-dependent protease
VFHEVAHGRVARWFGDSTAAEQGRLSFNPVRHVDPVGTLILPLLLALASAPIFGWAKPVPVNRYRLRDPRWNMVIVALAGPMMNIGLAVAAGIAIALLSWVLPEASEMTRFINTNLLNFITINLFLAVFNMLPIPPFDGSKVFGGFLPRPLREQFEALDRYGLVFLIGLLLVLPYIAPQADVLGRVVLPPVRWLFDHIVGLIGFISGG